MALMALPSLNIIDLKEPSWLDKRAGFITVVHTDEATHQPFVYVGTSTGTMFVIEIEQVAIRVCEYVITLGDCQLQGVALTDIQICPKVQLTSTIIEAFHYNSEKYLAAIYVKRSEVWVLTCAYRDIIFTLLVLYMSENIGREIYGPCLQ
jgi:hypothetical protein